MVVRKKIESPIHKGSRQGTDFGAGFYILNCMKIDRQINLISKKSLDNLKFLGTSELTLKEIFNLKENELLNLSTLSDKVFNARRNSNKDVYYIDLQDR